MTTHCLKTWPEFFDAVKRKDKRFELRKDDRGFSVGDVVILQEWNPKTESYTGNYFDFVVRYKLTGGQFGLEEGYCILNW